MSSRKYIRKENSAVKSFYEPCAEFMEETPPDIARFIEFIQRETGLPRNSKNYPVDSKTIAAAAKAFQKGAHEVFGFALDLENPDSTQLDCFANKHLIDPSLRKYFEGVKLRQDLTEKELEEYEQAAEGVRIPREPLLYYAMGAFWGEWLVRHRNAVWALYPPLNPIQSFVDIVTTKFHSACIHPFSQATKKLCDPDSDKLSTKAKAIQSIRNCLPPYPLLVSLEDAVHATLELLPTNAKKALEAERKGEDEKAFSLFSKAIEEQPWNAWLIALAISLGWRLQEWKKLEKLLRRLLELKPDHPAAYYNLAIAYSRTGKARGQELIELLEKAVELDPNYGRAHLSLAWYLVGARRLEEALTHAQWVYENDPKLRNEARVIIDGIKRARDFL
jgi:tetratricopeptide (TPR) repeat protein